MDIADNADYDPALSKQQLDVLAKTGIKAKHIEYEVAQYLAYISIHNALSEFEPVTEYLNKLHQIGIKLGNEWVLSLYYHKKARLALKQGQFLKGLDYSSQAITIAGKINFQELTARAKSVRAIFHSKRGDSVLALKDYQDALTFFESNNNNDLSMKVYLNLVTLYLDRQEYDKALLASDKVVTLLEQLPRKNIRAMAANYINRAIALSYLGKKEQELNAYNIAQDYAIRSNDIETLATIYANLSDYFLRNKHYQKAEKQAEHCIEASQRIKNINLVAICQLNQGLASVFLDKTKLGFTLLNTAINTIKTKEMYSSLSDGYLAMVHAYQYLNDDKTANTWLEKYYQVLLEQEKADKFAYFSQVEHDFQETVADRENTFISVKKDMLSNILTQDELVQHLIIAVIVMGVLLLLFIGLTLYYRNKLQNKHYNYK
ncbi:hypothetical protein GCM10011501_18250 [Thalassotalea profundi]|uniref:Tetratricopeptide repeat protein n=1 Tax=Thalassotalea profundi TaxID=2036687 RepID=A0ABQ3INW6_9GAMM|nr:hypothetical protein GCM10011501_18250 [Thalassotalea profundi]